MFKYLVRRMASLVPVIIMISILLFSLVKIMPGDPIKGMINPNIKDPVLYQETYKRIEAQFGMDKSLPEQYIRWVGRTVSGDLGYSTKYNKPVIDVIAKPMKNTVVLNLISFVISFVISIFVGIYSAVKRGGWFDKIWQVISLVGMSLPVVLIGLMLIYIFAGKLKWFPSSGAGAGQGKVGLAYALDWLNSMALPIFAITIGSFASIIRYVRNAMIDVLSSDYIRTARAKGLSNKVVIYSHAFRNALIPVVTIVAGSLAGLFSGAAITESIFSIDGIGKILVEAVTNRDFMMVLALNMFFASLSLIANIIMDIGYALVDPRVKLD
ncbi:ABC transporter permease [Erysipelothrix sp. HDW6C]|uniref:ABC transporter permease n=1 Tax=Erysipelothrix sp. HDW6C TaxID=2714930 RepID=UPI00140D8693|nr:ABC transporter permease [Erysipelothrix sp. HDW6C]QIK70494.1 ABC transporter permease [Erysipelothrix sp. HDW6C]